MVLHAAVNKINHLTKRLGKYLSSYNPIEVLVVTDERGTLEQLGIVGRNRGNLRRDNTATLFDKWISKQEVEASSGSEHLM